ncbi:hypothetical protein BIV57_19510 [Mangrovactinospora gilvigrisea]|uniref:Histidine kinase/HSP90-like ATPase domain-containing protein n=1 Tax=Mangrovactinospora gilvigrisea TaxID=1428644 RepID=A0A1J7BB09_9ACTN|nr:hypothetical protein BIV57_19510 [Mangrovactinospora gilvigrisea]
MPGPELWHFTAPTVESSVPQARRAVRDLLGSHGLAPGDPVVQDLLLIVSELVTNAVRHAALLTPEVRVEVAFQGAWVRVAVQDRHPYRPHALMSGATDFGRTGGRGLLLVKALTDEGGGRCDVLRTEDGGKVVWAELPRYR